jgi:hypothetical protein
LGRVLRCTVTAPALRDLAAALASSRLDDANALAVAEGVGVEVLGGAVTAVDYDYQRTPAFRITLMSSDLDPLARRLERLAKEPDRTAFSLGELGIISPESSTCDLVFCKRDEVVALNDDYRPRCPGSTWEAMLRHPPPTLEGLGRARDAFIAWCEPSPDRCERQVWTDTNDGEAALAVEVALPRLCDADDPVDILRLYGEHSLAVRFGSPFSDIKAWFHIDGTLLMVSEHCAASGDFRADIENFFRYRRLVAAFAGALGAEKVAWGDNAEDWPEDMVEPVAALDDSDVLWGWYTENLAPCLGGTPLPDWVGARFTEAFTREAGPSGGT